MTNRFAVVDLFKRATKYVAAEHDAVNEVIGMAGMIVVDRQRKRIYDGEYQNWTTVEVYLGHFDQLVWLRGLIGPERLIVSRHPAAIDFIRRTAPEFEIAPVLAQATEEEVRGKIVAGNLPFHLASAATEVVAVEFTGAPPRGTEYGIVEMVAVGARLRRYRVFSEDSWDQHELLIASESSQIVAAAICRPESFQ